MLREQQALFLTTCLTILLTIYFALHFLSPPPTASLLPANSTLNFGTILAVSPPNSPRRASLLWAANLTGIDIVIPTQPAWTEIGIQSFKAIQGSKISRGGALAWMGHLNCLRWFLQQTTHSTALILEDDTDFSLFLRSTQIPLLASSLRELFNATTSTSYWGPPPSWDILYPGHCDDLPFPSRYLSNPHTLYTDTNTPPQHITHPDTSAFLSSLSIPHQTRILHRTFYPFCTFAYALTRSAASSLLAQYSKEKEGGIDAFEVQLLELCRDKPEWKCWSVSPEVFHHGVGRSAIQAADVNRSASVSEGGGEGFERATWNLACGARDTGMWVDEKDAEGRERVKEFVQGMVGRGECPINGVEGERSWTGCVGGGCGAQS